MAVNTTDAGWVPLPGGRYVSPVRMRDPCYSDSGIFFKPDHHLSPRQVKDIEYFNSLARQYDIRPIAISDPFIDRIVRFSVLESRMKEDGSFMPDNVQYVNMALDAAAARARYDELVKKEMVVEAQKFEPLADFYKTLTSGPWDAVTDVLKFQGIIKTGRHKGKYRATPCAFDANGVLVESDDAITIPPEGWITVLGRRGYPVETAKGAFARPIESIEDVNLQIPDYQGKWLIGLDPVVGEERLVVHGPGSPDGLLSASVVLKRSCPYVNDMDAFRMRA
jgi:hypothetical protein